MLLAHGNASSAEGYSHSQMLRATIPRGTEAEFCCVPGNNIKFISAYGEPLIIIPVFVILQLDEETYRILKIKLQAYHLY